jgi:methylenetetrahydrofolate reductase (NADPH)
MTDLKVSFEFFPPKTEEAEEKLWGVIKELEVLRPAFVSVTYGAGGSTRERTHNIVKRIADKTTLKPASHLTCVNATKEEINAIAKNYWDNGIKHIVALRGDPPDMKGDYIPHPGGYQYAGDLVAGLKQIADFEISVAAYPEVHPTANSAEDDLKHLKEKLEAGGNRAITQFFFEADYYFDFLEKAEKLGIKAPIVPGVLPISNFAQAVRFANMCNTKVPKWLANKYAGLDEKPEERNKISIEVTTELCQKLISGGVEHIHFYTLNRADLTAGVMQNIT